MVTQYFSFADATGGRGQHRSDKVKYWIIGNDYRIGNTYKFTYIRIYVFRINHDTESQSILLYLVRCMGVTSM